MKFELCEFVEGVVDVGGEEIGSYFVVVVIVLEIGSGLG